SEPQDAQWPSRYGAGRPGWHLECSAMSGALLGEQFDIHGGGADLQFPHHENEIAQSQGATGKPPARFWMHNGFVTRDNEKMSKSLGNFFTIRDILQRYDAETVRFFIARAHYRSPLPYSDAHLDDARNSLGRLYNALADGDEVLRNWKRSGAVKPLLELDHADGLVDGFIAAMDEDFGTPQAIATLFDIASDIGAIRRDLTQIPEAESAFKKDMVDILQRKVVTLRSLGATIGLLQQDPIARKRIGATLDARFIESLIEARAVAKAARDYAEADRIRSELLERGIVLKDTAAGTTWEVAR
ncbi:MAG: class I tRNA ligase family protein, partial [Proteobacteria bacterium]|nr:class I tRNA ligase family protein [Pseudomonadota bacterium]